ncbi:hypothetical protein [Kalamiella sp. sgz302252]|uniref:hypothetical protein n=1 Tax=Pantoea sp. sgz302252 TaxID=3341827 RepID=UPI0036D36846
MSGFNLTLSTDKKKYSPSDDIIYTAKLTNNGMPVQNEEISIVDAESAVKNSVLTDSNGEAKFISHSSKKWSKATYTRTVMFGIKAQVTFEVV